MEGWSHCRGSGRGWIQGTVSICQNILCLRWVVTSRSQKSIRFSWTYLFLIPNFRRVLNVVCFLLVNSLASDFFIPTCIWRWNGHVPKRRHIKFRRRGITQKKAYNKMIIFGYVINTCERAVMYQWRYRLDDPSLIPDWHVGIFLCTVISIVYLLTHWLRDQEFSKLNLRVPHTLASPVVMLGIIFFAFCSDLDS